MPHIREFAIQFFLGLLTLILFGVGCTNQPNIAVPVLLHLAALVAAGYVTRPGRTLTSQYVTTGLFALAGLVWTVYALAYVYGANTETGNVLYAAYVFYFPLLFYSVWICKTFRHEIELDQQQSIQLPAPGMF